jgi:WD40 repeat protein
VPNSFEPWTAVFSSDGNTVSAAGLGGVYAWNLDDLDVDPKLLLRSKNWATEIAFSPDGNILTVASFDPIILLQHLTRSGKPAFALRGHGEGGTWSVAFSADGNRLASGGRDATVRLWNPNAPKESSILLGQHDKAVTRVRFSPNGKQLASVSLDHSMKLWTLNKPDELPIVLSGHEDEVWSLAYSPDGQYLVSGSADNTIRIWD